MIELVSGMPEPQFEDESCLNARIRASPRFKQLLCFVLSDVRCFCLLPGVRLPQVEDRWSGQQEVTVPSRLA
jgi:hypothetical protein